MLDKYAIVVKYVDKNGKETAKNYTGKVINTTFYRNFPFGKSTLWSKKGFGFNVELFNYLKEHGVKKLVFIDTAKTEVAREIGIKKADNIKQYDIVGVGRQYFIQVDQTDKVDSVPKIGFVKKEVVIVVRPETITTEVNE